jgi:hypothetical protein
MESFSEYINEYKELMREGVVRKAYQGVMQYIMALRTYFSTKYPDYFVSGSIYFGYMDMTYFSFQPESFKQRKLRVAIVFIHETCQFQIWLAGYNKLVQSKYWKLLRESDWNGYPIVPSTNGVDSIIEYTIVQDTDFTDLDGLTHQIENSALRFIQDIETFLILHEN